MPPRSLDSTLFPYTTLFRSNGVLAETPKQGDRAFRYVNNVIVGCNRESCRAAASYLNKEGYHSQVLSTRIVGEAREAGRDRKSTRLNSSHRTISYAVFCLKK